MDFLRLVRRWWLNICIGMDTSYAEELRAILRNKSCSINHHADATARLERVEARLQRDQKELQNL